MPDRWDKYREEAPDKWERYRDPDEPGLTARVPAQESVVGLGERALLQTVAPHDPQSKADWLQKRGYTAQPTEAGQVAVQKQDGSGRWGVIDPTKAELMDIVDAADEIAFGIGAGMGGAATATAGPMGLLASGKGAAIGGASVEAVRQALGAAAGFERTPGEVLTDVAVSGALAGVGEPLLRGAGRGLRGAGKWMFRGKAKPEPARPEGFVGRGERVKEAALEPAQTPTPRPGVPQTVEEVLESPPPRPTPPPGTVAPEGLPGPPTREPPPPRAVEPRFPEEPLEKPIRGQLEEQIDELLKRGLMTPEEHARILRGIAEEPPSMKRGIREEIYPETLKPGRPPPEMPPEALPAPTRPQPRGEIPPQAKLLPAELEGRPAKEPELWAWSQRVAPRLRVGGTRRGRPPDDVVAERVYRAFEESARDKPTAWTRLVELGASPDDAASALLDPPPAAPAQARADLRFRPTKQPSMKRFRKGPPPIGGGVGLPDRIQIPLDEVVGSIQKGQLGIDEVATLVGLRQQMGGQEHLEVTFAVRQALDDAMDAGTIDTIRYQEFSEWLKNIGFLKPKGGPQPLIPGARRGVGMRDVVAPTDDPQAPYAMVKSTGQRDMTVQWQGSEIGFFDNTPEGRTLAGNLASYLDEVAREGEITARVGAGIDDVLKQGGHGESDLRALDSWLKETVAKRVTPMTGRVKVKPMTTWGDDVDLIVDDESFARFYGQDNVDAAMKAKEILDDVLDEPEIWREARRPLFKKLREGGHTNLQAHEVLDELDAKVFERPPETRIAWDDVNQEHDLMLGQHRLVSFADDEHVSDARYLIDEFEGTLRERPLKSHEWDELKEALKKATDLDEARDAFWEIREQIEPSSGGYWGGMAEPKPRLSAAEADFLKPLDQKKVQEFIAGAKGKALVTIKKKDGTLRTMEVAERPPQIERAEIEANVKDLSDKELVELVQESGVPKAPKPIGEKYKTTNPAELPREALVEWLYESQPAVVTGRGKGRAPYWERKGPYATGTRKGEGRPMAIPGTREEGAYRAPGTVIQVEAGGKRLRSSGIDAAPEAEPSFKPGLKRTSVAGPLRKRPLRGKRKAPPIEKPPMERELPEVRPPKALPEPEPEWVEEPRWEADPTQWEPEPPWELKPPPRGLPAPELPVPKGGPGPRFDQPPQPPFTMKQGARLARDVYTATTKPGQARFLWRKAVELAQKFAPEKYQTASEAVKRALGSIQRILETAGMQAALAAAYSLIKGNQEFRQWLEKQRGPSTETAPPAAVGER